MSQDFIDVFFNSIAKNPQQAMLDWQAQQLTAGLMAPGRKAFKDLETTLSAPSRGHATLNFPVIWAMGAARLYDCSPTNQSGPVVLIVPSLNQTPDAFTSPSGLIDHLTEKGIRPFLLDWSGVSSFEMEMTLKDYTHQFIQPVIRHLSSYVRRPVTVFASEFSGPLVLDSANESVHRLVLYCIPCDFSSDYPLLRSWLSVWGDVFCQMVERLSVISPNLLNDLLNQFRPQQLRPPVSLYPFAPKVFRDILLGWVRDNTLNKRQKTYQHRSLVLIPKDHAVFSVQSMTALTNCLPNSTTMNFKGGLCPFSVNDKNNKKMFGAVTDFVTRDT